MRVVAIIQARMGSTRLPGKVLLPLAGKSMLQNIIERVSRAKLLDEIVVAIPKDAYNDVLFELNDCCDAYVIAPMCPENDLISRYFIAASQADADLVVRICSDNPLVEPGEIDRAIEYYLKRPRFFVSNMHEHQLVAMQCRRFNQYPDGIGCEVFSFSTLQWMNEELYDPKYREHQHLYWHDEWLIDSPQCPSEFARPDLKLDVNTQAEYEYIKDIYDHFGHNEFHITEVIKYLDSKNLA